jgi:hypothetical protein
MARHEFIFESDIAKIKDIINNNIVLVQPGKPGPDGLTSWVNEEEARDWIYHQFPTFFEEEPEPIIPNIPEPVPNPNLETTPGE